MSDQGVRLMPASELVLTDWSLPAADKIGYMRTVCRGIRGAGASLGVGIMPVGQRSPLHTTNSEHLLLGLAGELTWCVEGESFVMREMDLLFIGAGHEYDYWNSSFETARFVDVIGRVNIWPPGTDYKV
ncbi:MAG: cupin domain-containing protein [Acidimicrobiales bacterium]